MLAYKGELQRDYKYLSLLTMLFITTFVVCDTTAYRMTNLWGSVVPVSGMIIPFVFFLGDIIAEIYGYHITRKLIWNGLFCQAFFGVLITFAVHFPSPPNNHVNFYYILTFQHVLRANITSCLSVTSGMFTNAFLMSKFKIFMNGKKFWFRTILSSGSSEAVLCIVAYIMLYAGMKSTHEIIDIIWNVWVYKMLFAIVVAPLGSVIARWLKHAEALDVYDRGINYSPFIYNHVNNRSFVSTIAIK